MPAGSVERTNARREEILNACEKLYATTNFKDITLKEIGKETTFTRSSIYNYFHTKEEIFLGLLKREYDLWISALNRAIRENTQMSDAEIADCIARTLSPRQLLLKLLSTNRDDLENHCRLEALVEFKTSFGQALSTMAALLSKFRPDLEDDDIQEFLFTLFPFMFGIYPYTMVTDRQQEAMKQAGVRYMYNSAYDLIKKAVLKMLPARN